MAAGGEEDKRKDGRGEGNLCVLGLERETMVAPAWEKSRCSVGLGERSRSGEEGGEGEEKWREKRETNKGGGVQVLRESERGGITSFNLPFQQREIERGSFSWGVGGARGGVVGVREALL